MVDVIQRQLFLFQTISRGKADETHDRAQLELKRGKNWEDRWTCDTSEYSSLFFSVVLED
jgi:hypothetical protein